MSASVIRRMRGRLFNATDLTIMLGRNLNIKNSYRAADRLLQKAKKDGLIRYIKGWWVVIEPSGIELAADEKTEGAA